MKDKETDKIENVWIGIARNSKFNGILLLPSSRATN